MIWTAMPLGCSNDACAPELVDHAVDFMNAHMACTEDADCVVVPDYCETLPGGFCGQLTMNRSGANSAEWSDIDRELKSCGPERCTVCDAGLVPRCKDGSCASHFGG